MKYWQLFLHFLLVICTFQVARPLNILTLIGAPIQEYSEWYRVLFQALAARKHNLTIISHKAGADTFNASYINLELEQTNYQMAMREFPYELGEKFGHLNSLSDLKSWYRAQEEQCDLIMQTPGYQKVIAELLRAPPEIDLILYDITFDPWCVLMLADFYENVSIFAFSVFKALPEHFEIARGGLMSPGVIPSFISHYTENMRILERFWNGILYWYGYYLKFSKTADNIAVIMTKNPTVSKYGLPRKLKDVMSRIKLIFVNSHPAIDYSIPLPPNIIEIGGMHVRKPEHLHDGIKDAIAKGHKGAIFMDLGKHMTIQKLGPKMVNDMIIVIQRNHDYIFLWNVEDSELIEEHPKNLFTDSTFQRNEILAYPEVKLFITVASNLNIQESIYFGVPLVIIPLNMDQPHNAVRVVERQFGHYLLYKNINVPNFHRIIVDTLNCEVCTKNVQMAKYAIHSNPHKPLDTIIGWIENEAVKYPESYDYLVSRSAEHRSYFVTHSLDIVAMSIIIISVLLILIVMLLYYMYLKILRICIHLRNIYRATLIHHMRANHMHRVIRKFFDRARTLRANIQVHQVVNQEEAVNNQPNQALSDVSDDRLAISEISSDHSTDEENEYQSI